MAAASSESEITTLEIMDDFKRMYGYTAPYHALCEADFVRYVQDQNNGITVKSVLKRLLGDEVNVLTTHCISRAVKSLYGGEGGHHQQTKMRPCEHGYEDYDPSGVLCFKLFARAYPSHRLVVCTMNDTTLHSKYPGRVVVAPDSERRGDIMIFNVANPLQQLGSRVPKEIRIMDEYRRIFGYKSPFTTICDPKFVNYLEGKKKDPSIELENLLGGTVKLVSTPCITKNVWRSNATIQQCNHAVQVHPSLCMKEFVDGYPSRKIVVCTSSVKAREYYASVPGLIVITPDLRGGIEIDRFPSEVIIDAIMPTQMIDPVMHRKKPSGKESSRQRKKQRNEIFENDVVRKKKKKIIEKKVKRERPTESSEEESSVSRRKKKQKDHNSREWSFYSSSGPRPDAGKQRNEIFENDVGRKKKKKIIEKKVKRERPTESSEESSVSRRKKKQKDHNSREWSFYSSSGPRPDAGKQASLVMRTSPCVGGKRSERNIITPREI